jgi:N-acyl homoserine lactone hydrolase
MMIKGRPQSLTVLDFGLFRVGDARTIGIPGFLITTDCGERILVDTGFPDAYAQDAKAAARCDGLDAFGKVLALGAENLVTGQLALLGLAPSDITLLILTHSHIDHVGGLAYFAGRPVLLGAAERALPRPLYWGAAQPMDWPDAQYLTIDRDTDLSCGLRVLHVPGHAPGQLALWMDLPQTGAVLLTSDAISRPAEIDEGFAGAHDIGMAADSAARLMALSRSAFTIWGHCPSQWPGLRKSPDAYV